MVYGHNRLLARDGGIEMADDYNLELERSGGDPYYDDCLVGYGIVYDTFENCEPFDLPLQAKK